jgi:hypothetical protein
MEEVLTVSTSRSLSCASAAKIISHITDHHHLFALLIMERLPHPPASWVDKVEPHYSCGHEGEAFHSCHSILIKADLLPGTFVLLATTSANAGECQQEDVIARIVKPVGSTQPLKVQVNIFRNILQPQGIVENQLRHLPARSCANR